MERFLDIEGIPDQDFNYLIGVVVKHREKNKMHSFWADDFVDETRIFMDFLALADKYPMAPIYHYGSYQRRAIERTAERHRLNGKEVLARLVNVNGLVTARSTSLRVPTGRKTLAWQLGIWPTPNPLASRAWRGDTAGKTRAKRSSDEPVRQVPRQTVTASLNTMVFRETTTMLNMR